MMKYARRRWDDVEGCEDVVVDALFIAWQKWRDRPDETLERAWLYGITFRVLAMSFPRKSRHGLCGVVLFSSQR